MARLTASQRQTIISKALEQAEQALNLITDELNLADTRQKPSDILRYVLTATLERVRTNPDEFYVQNRKTR